MSHCPPLLGSLPILAPPSSCPSRLFCFSFQGQGYVLLLICLFPHQTRDSLRGGQVSTIRLGTPLRGWRLVSSSGLKVFCRAGTVSSLKLETSPRAEAVSPSDWGSPLWERLCLSSPGAPSRQQLSPHQNKGSHEAGLSLSRPGQEGIYSV